MLRPWWIGMLLFALVVAAVFAWLGQWQLGRAIDTNPPPAGATEQVQPIAAVTAPGEYLPEPLVGQRVAVAGTFVAGDFLVVSSRFNDGQEVLGHGPAARRPRLRGGIARTSLAVAIGWAATREAADAAASALDATAASTPPPPPPRARRSSPAASSPTKVPCGRHGQPATEMTRMSPAALLGWWHDIRRTERLPPVPRRRRHGRPWRGLVAIDSPAPTEGRTSTG
ncbi:MAG: SURF1 family cytochrome oxidase biogenesis protein [Microbacterium sp.]